jgi:hypothetical protein
MTDRPWRALLASACARRIAAARDRRQGNPALAAFASTTLLGAAARQKHPHEQSII